MVQLMTPGLALFYGGLVGAESVTSVMFQAFMCIGIVFCLWVLVSFSLTFGEPYVVIAGAKLLGDPFTYFMWHHVDIYEPLQKADAVVAADFPGMIFAGFQGMFAVISPAIISGAFAQRLHFWPFMFLIVYFNLVVYAPLGFWNWGGGWMFQTGAWDFAGGIVVHESAGCAALAGVLVLGNRATKANQKHGDLKKAHNIPMVFCGTALLWFGWFGFNAGSASAIGGLAGISFVNTQIAPSVGMVVWVVLERLHTGKTKLVGACTGAISGLVVVTPSAGFIQPDNAFIAGIIGSIVGFYAILILERLGFDDAVDAFAIHGVVGLTGTVLVGVLSDPALCGSKDLAPEWCANPGTVTRSFHQTLIQLMCGLAACTYAFTMTWIALKVMEKLGLLTTLPGLKEQASASDYLQHGEIAYHHPAIMESMGKHLAADYKVDAGDSSGDEETQTEFTEGSTMAGVYEYCQPRSSKA
eukprot:TRINITY_DN28154_c0_g2_i1.p1 TRINITY_DN28154_c0_g2~~TRINITY_DN28154_c0_g2_i1.p1  ORF type:complete len:524 (+),score=82.84 TRINITY_DN28154_c0_g2_i1:168-1574(+)